jgi:hypothetical protein
MPNVYVSKLDKARDEVLEEYLAWALETFPEETLIQQAIHLVKETKELDELEAGGPGKDRHRLLEERADVAFIAVLIACRIIERCENEGIGLGLVQAMATKLDRNKRRRWGRTEDGDYQHVCQICGIARKKHSLQPHEFAEFVAAIEGACLSDGEGDS